MSVVGDRGPAVAKFEAGGGRNHGSRNPDKIDSDTLCCNALTLLEIGLGWVLKELSTETSMLEGGESPATLLSVGELRELVAAIQTALLLDQPSLAIEYLLWLASKYFKAACLATRKFFREQCDRDEAERAILGKIFDNPRRGSAKRRSPSRKPNAPKDISELRDALLSGDYDEARSILQKPKRRDLGYSRLAHDLLAVTLADIGEQWEKDRIGVAEEHLALWTYKRSDMASVHRADGSQRMM